MSLLVQGILIGGSLGVFASLFGLHDSMFRAIGFGMVAGFFASYTLMKIRKNKNK